MEVPNYWKVKPIKLHFNLDSDRDGVPDWKDCRPFNPRKQHEVMTDKKRVSIIKSITKGKDTSKLTYPEFKRITKEYAEKIPIIKVVNGYGIYAYKDKRETLYHAVDMKTGLQILANRTSLSEITRDIKEGQPEELRKRFPEIFSPKKTYESTKRFSELRKKYEGRAKRFRKYGGQKVLDVGAGDNPDYRATHSIDLMKPQDRYKGLNCKWGYDFNKESTNLPYPDNSFHVVVSYGGLGRNFESKNICKEIYRVLKSGGRFEFNPDSENSVKWIKDAGFKNLHMENYFDEYLNKKIPVVVAMK